MPALIEQPPHAASSLTQPSLQSPSRLLNQVTGSPLASITEGLAMVLGQGQSIPQPQPARLEPASRMFPAPAQQQQQVAPTQPVPITAQMTVEQLLQRLQPVQGAQPVADEGLEALRMQMFGRYYQEIEGRMAEVSKALEGGVARARRAMLERVDELGAALHRDMVALRQETQKDVEELKRDVFTTVMSLSAINDKLSLADSRNRETWVAVTRALTERIDHQAKSQAEIIDGFRKGIDEGMEQRIAKTVESTLMRLASVRRPANAPAQAPATTQA